MQIFRDYKAVRKYYGKKYGLNDPELEAIISLDSLRYFYYEDFKEATYILRWDKYRWKRWKDDGFFKMWRQAKGGRDGYKKLWCPTAKTRAMVDAIYETALGKREMPMGISSPFYKQETYTDKVMNTTVDRINKRRNNSKD